MRLWKPCSRCPEPVPPGQTLCPACRAEGDRRRRPTGSPYSTAGHQAFREAVLARDPICVVCRRSPATVADHYPIERRDLELRGLGPNDPNAGRGLCKTCHDRHTALTLGFGG